MHYLCFDPISQAMKRNSDLAASEHSSGRKLLTQIATMTSRSSMFMVIELPFSMIRTEVS